MSSSTVPNPLSEIGARPSAAGHPGWLFGRGVDLLFGYGGLYLLTIPLLAFATLRTGWAAWPGGVTALIALAVSTPHYGATLVRVYEERRDRRKYAFFAVHVSWFLLIVFGAGLHDAVLGSLVITAYVSWSPWHFAGQNYGLAMMSLGRRRVPVDALTKKLLRVSFVLSFLLALLVVHADGPGLVFAQGSDDASQSFGVLRLGLPMTWVVPAGAVLGLGYLGVLGVAAARLLRVAGRPSALLPAALLVAMQALWFVLPATYVAVGGRGGLGLAFAAIWISAAHAVQYLWVTAYYAKRDVDHPARPASFLTRSMLAGCAMMFTPLLLFVPGLLGPAVPLSAGVQALWFAILNLHHFILDGAVWKLRDAKVASVLLGDDGERAAPTGVSGRHWLRPFVYGLGLVCFMYPLYLMGEAWYGSRPRAPLARVEASAARLAFLGNDTELVTGNLAAIYARGGRTDEAIAKHREALALNPLRADLAFGLADLLLDHKSDEASRAEALDWAREASRLRGHRDSASLRLLARANVVNGRPEAAERALERARAVGAARGR